MIGTSIRLITYNTYKDSIGNELRNETYNEVPIIRVESIYANEFYQASQQGLRPSLRIKISSTSYHDELELDYLSKRYSIIRTQLYGDELVLICERKIKNEGR